MDKCEWKLTAGIPWILPRISSPTWRAARGEEETKQCENLKLLKGPGTLRNIDYIFELSLKIGGKNIIFMFLDNSIYEIT